MWSLQSKTGAALSLSALLLVFACFSERSSLSGPGDGDCNAILPEQEQAAGSIVVLIRDYEFLPANLTVPRNSRVTWINCGPNDAHTSTADNGSWNSGDLIPGTSFTRTFGTAGDFGYFCVPHPFMRGRIIVQ
jgi:plastocyanin